MEPIAPQLAVTELARMRDSGEKLVILDIREPWETAICAIEGALTIPLGALAGRMQELPKDEPLVVLCHHGVRSAQATAWLQKAGFENAVNLTGGIDEWARRIDPSMPTY